MTTWNIGDMMCPVSLHFDLGESKILDLCRVKSNDFNVNDADVVVVGGGGLFFFDSLKYLMEICTKPIIGWGIGCNEHGCQQIRYPQYAHSFTLLGTRDWNTEFEWVPCPSCMDSIFNESIKMQHDVVVYEHKDRPLGLDFPTKNNSVSFPEAIRHIASGSTVLTNTYHGMYWGTLLSRKVIAFPFSSRFYGMKYPVRLSEDGSWKESDGAIFPEALEECREANTKFYKRFMEYL